MNNVQFRRIALSFASICAVVSGILLTICSLYIPKPVSGQTVDVYSAEQTTISFPSTVSGTELIVRNMASYDGIFYEDGSNAQVFNTAAIVLENTSSETVIYTQIKLEAETKLYIFEAMMLPPGSSTLVPEKKRQQVTEDNFYSCSGWAFSDHSSNAQNIKIHSTGNGAITVQNISSKTLHNIILYHKTYLMDSLLFIGGTATQTKIQMLFPGQTTTIRPLCYADGYSKFVYIS